MNEVFWGYVRWPSYLTWALESQITLRITVIHVGATDSTVLSCEVEHHARTLLSVRELCLAPDFVLSTRPTPGGYIVTSGYTL